MFTIRDKLMLCRLVFTVVYNEVLVYFFFFQAEDGIRDLTVTGVQTCALPILRPESDAVRHGDFGSDGVKTERGGAAAGQRIARSEERRVGKECRSRGATDH